MKCLVVTFTTDVILNHTIGPSKTTLVGLAISIQMRIGHKPPPTSLTRTAPLLRALTFISFLQSQTFGEYSVIDTSVSGPKVLKGIFEGIGVDYPTFTRPSCP